MSDALDFVLSELPPSAPIDSLDAWWARHKAIQRASTFDRALVGGFEADRVGYAFASGYREALVSLLPEADHEGSVTILSVTEDAGIKPSALKTTLERTGADGGFVLEGRKKWATLATRADRVLVAAREAAIEGASGRPVVRVALVPISRAGVTVTPMPETPFAPEIPHAAVSFERVQVASNEVLEGDGWSDYVKPFRTVEDIHVHAALAGYSIAIARRFALSSTHVESIAAVAVALGALAASSPTSPSAHVALAGVCSAFRATLSALEVEWFGRSVSASGEAIDRARWARDKPLFDVASSARKLRLEAAWRDLGGARSRESTG